MRQPLALLATLFAALPAAAQETDVAPTAPDTTPTTVPDPAPATPAMPTTPAMPAGPETQPAPAGAGPAAGPTESATPEPAAATPAGPAGEPATPTSPAGTEAAISPPEPVDPPAAADPALSAPVTPVETAPATAPVTAPALPDMSPDAAMPLSPLDMFLHADIVVQSVMIGLVFASVLTWTVFIVKLIELIAASRRVSRGQARIEAAPDLHSALQATTRRHDPASRMLRAAAHELKRSAPALAQGGQQGVRERVASHLDRIEARAGRGIARGTGLLAIVGSTAPFVGLFGTVWGIMNSFIGIAKAQTTSLSVVAPGIAEALLATGIGLVAAIPAVVIYNLFARATAGYRLRLGDASATVQRLVSRELDMNGVTTP